MTVMIFIFRYYQNPSNAFPRRSNKVNRLLAVNHHIQSSITTSSYQQHPECVQSLILNLYNSCALRQTFVRRRVEEHFRIKGMMGIIDKVVVNLKYVPFSISFLFRGFIIDLDKGLQDGTARAGSPTAAAISQST